MSDPEVLGRILVMQSVVSNLPDEEGMFGFICRGLEDVPGVTSVSWEPQAPAEASGALRKPVKMGTKEFGALVFEIAQKDLFCPYEPYLDNFCFMVAVILEGRFQRQLNERQTASLTRSLAELEKAHLKIIESEKMAVLGQLVATIAHEVNTPLAAIRSSASFLLQDLVGRSEAMLDFSRSLELEDFTWFKSLLARKPREYAAGAGSRARRHRLSQALEKAGVVDPEAMADDITLLADPNGEGALVDAVLRGKGEVVRQAARFLETIHASTIILEASDRAASTVADLVGYSHGQEVNERTAIDPAKELNTLLRLFPGLSLKGLGIVREFEPGLMVQGDRDKLNQVWINLINNALQAMEYHGNLILRTRSVENGAEIVVANDGPPVPDDLKEKIFQPFFTTKRPGQGTGLGLDICLRVVGAHHGTLTLTQEESLTVFRVFLPD